MLRIPIIFWRFRALSTLTFEVAEFVAREGGVVIIARRMEMLGLGARAAAWMERGSLEPLGSEQLHRLFGTGVLRAWAAKVNAPQRDVLRLLSELLPGVMHRLATEKISTEVTWNREATPSRRSVPGVIAVIQD